MSRDIECREASKTDLAAVLRLYAQPDMDDGKVLSLEAAEAIFDRFGRYPDYRLYVAVAQGQVVGTFAMLIMENLAHFGAPSAVIEDMVVHPDWQGRGIGTSMVEHALRVCGENRCYKLALSSGLRRERAHAFYESLGFERHGYSFRTLLPRERAGDAGRGGRS